MSRRRFVGRDVELRAIEAALAGATQGRGVLVVVSGEAGIGKSSLCLQLADTAQRLGFAVATARCWVEGGAPPLWPWQPLLAELCGADAAELLAGDARGAAGAGGTGDIDDQDGVGGASDHADDASETAVARSGGVDPDRFARFEAVTRRLAETCARTPVCVVIDRQTPPHRPNTPERAHNSRI